MTNTFLKKIEEMKENGLFNNIKTIESEQGAFLTIGGKKYLNMSSNNYLGLASHPRVKKAAIQAIEKFGVGTASVRSLVGTNSLHLELERRLAEFKNAEAAIVVTSGYLANLASIQTITDKEAIENAISFSTSGEKMSQLKKRSPIKRIPIKVMQNRRSTAREAVIFSIFLLSIKCIIILYMAKDKNNPFYAMKRDQMFNGLQQKSGKLSAGKKVHTAIRLPSRRNP
jgi:hypothetical protein